MSVAEVSTKRAINELPKMQRNKTGIDTTKGRRTAIRRMIQVGAVPAPSVGCIDPTQHCAYIQLLQRMNGPYRTSSPEKRSESMKRKRKAGSRSRWKLIQPYLYASFPTLKAGTCESAPAYRLMVLIRCLRSRLGLMAMNPARVPRLMLKSHKRKRR